MIKFYKIFEDYIISVGFNKKQEHKLKCQQKFIISLINFLSIILLNINIFNSITVSRLKNGANHYQTWIITKYYPMDHPALYLNFAVSKYKLKFVIS